MPLSTYPRSVPVHCINFSRVRSTLTPGSDLRASDNEPLSLLASSGGTITEWKIQEEESSGEEEVVSRSEVVRGDDLNDDWEPVTRSGSARGVRRGLMVRGDQ